MMNKNLNWRESFLEGKEVWVLIEDNGQCSFFLTEDLARSAQSYWRIYADPVKYVFTKGRSNEVDT